MTTDPLPQQSTSEGRSRAKGWLCHGALLSSPRAGGAGQIAEPASEDEPPPDASQPFPRSGMAASCAHSEEPA